MTPKEVRGRLSSFHVGALVIILITGIPIVLLQTLYSVDYGCPQAATNDTSLLVAGGGGLCLPLLADDDDGVAGQDAGGSDALTVLLRSSFLRSSLMSVLQQYHVSAVAVCHHHHSGFVSLPRDFWHKRLLDMCYSLRIGVILPLWSDSDQLYRARYGRHPAVVGWQQYDNAGAASCPCKPADNTDLSLFLPLGGAAAVAPAWWRPLLTNSSVVTARHGAGLFYTLHHNASWMCFRVTQSNKTVCLPVGARNASWTSRPWLVASLLLFAVLSLVMGLSVCVRRQVTTTTTTNWCGRCRYTDAGNAPSSLSQTVTVTLLGGCCDCPLPWPPSLQGICDEIATPFGLNGTALFYYVTKHNPIGPTKAVGDLLPSPLMLGYVNTGGTADHTNDAYGFDDRTVHSLTQRLLFALSAYRAAGLLRRCPRALCTMLTCVAPNADKSEIPSVIHCLHRLCSVGQDRMVELENFFVNTVSARGREKSNRDDLLLSLFTCDCTENAESCMRLLLVNLPPVASSGALAVLGACGSWLALHIYIITYSAFGATWSTSMCMLLAYQHSVFTVVAGLRSRLFGSPFSIKSVFSLYSGRYLCAVSLSSACWYIMVTFSALILVVAWLMSNLPPLSCRSQAPSGGGIFLWFVEQHSLKLVLSFWLSQQAIWILMVKGFGSSVASLVGSIKDSVQHVHSSCVLLLVLGGEFAWLRLAMQSLAYDRANLGPVCINVIGAAPCTVLGVVLLVTVLITQLLVAQAIFMVLGVVYGYVMGLNQGFGDHRSWDDVHPPITCIGGGPALLQQQYSTVGGGRLLWAGLWADMYERDLVSAACVERYVAAGDLSIAPNTAEAELLFTLWYAGHRYLKTAFAGVGLASLSGLQSVKEMPSLSILIAMCDEMVLLPSPPPITNYEGTQQRQGGGGCRTQLVLQHYATQRRAEWELFCVRVMCLQPPSAVLGHVLDSEAAVVGAWLRALHCGLAKAQLVDGSYRRLEWVLRNAPHGVLEYVSKGALQMCVSVQAVQQWFCERGVSESIATLLSQHTVAELLGDVTTVIGGVLPVCLREARRQTRECTEWLFFQIDLWICLQCQTLARTLIGVRALRRALLNLATAEAIGEQAKALPGSATRSLVAAIPADSDGEEDRRAAVVSTVDACWVQLPCECERHDLTCGGCMVLCCWLEKYYFSATDHHQHRGSPDCGGEVVQSHHQVLSDIEMRLILRMIASAHWYDVYQFFADDRLCHLLDMCQRAHGLALSPGTLLFLNDIQQRLRLSVDARRRAIDTVSSKLQVIVGAQCYYSAEQERDFQQLLCYVSPWIDLVIPDGESKVIVRRPHTPRGVWFTDQVCGASLVSTKACNQNAMAPYAWGHLLLPMDMNQDVSFAEGLKFPLSLAASFGGGGNAGPTTSLLALREHIYSHRDSVVGRFTAAADFGFRSLVCRFLDYPHGVRLHYGHGDVVQAGVARSVGGLSPADGPTAISEDIFLGYRLLEGGCATLMNEGVLLGKGRSVAFDEACRFARRVAGGCIAQLGSPLMVQVLLGPVRRSSAVLLSSVGFLMSTLLMDTGIIVFHYLLLILSLHGITGRQLLICGSVLSHAWVLQIGHVYMLPLLAEMLLITCYTKLSDSMFSAMFFSFQGACMADEMRATLVRGSTSYIRSKRLVGLRFYGFVALAKQHINVYDCALSRIIIALLLLWQRTNFVQALSLLAHGLLILCAPVVLQPLPSSSEWYFYTQEYWQWLFCKNGVRELLMYTARDSSWGWRVVCACARTAVLLLFVGGSHRAYAGIFAFAALFAYGTLQQLKQLRPRLYHSGGGRVARRFVLPAAGLCVLLFLALGDGGFVTALIVYVAIACVWTHTGHQIVCATGVLNVSPSSSVYTLLESGAFLPATVGILAAHLIQSVAYLLCCAVSQMHTAWFFGVS